MNTNNSDKPVDADKTKAKKEQHAKVDKMKSKPSKAKDPLVLRILLWVLLAIFLIGSPIAITIFSSDSQNNKAALQLEIRIERSITDFKSTIITEQENLDAKRFQNAHNIAIEGSLQDAIIEKLFKQYFSLFDEDTAGFTKVKELFNEFSKLRETFYKINEKDPLKLAEEKNFSE